MLTRGPDGALRARPRPGARTRSWTTRTASNLLARQ